MSYQAILLAQSAIFTVIGPITYIVSIARGYSKPHRMTRFIVAFVLTLNFFSILAAQGNTGAVVFAGISFAQALVILLMSFWRGMGGASLLDFACLGIAAVGIVGWKITGNPLMGVCFSILADLAAYIPAFVKTWNHPKTESPWYYAMSGVAACLGLIAYRLDSSSIFQIYIALCCIIMIGLIYRKSLVVKVAVRKVKS